MEIEDYINFVIDEYRKTPPIDEFQQGILAAYTNMQNRYFPTIEYKEEQEAIRREELAILYG